MPAYWNGTEITTPQLLPGEGVVIENNTINVATPVKIMTQAEYDALPDKQNSGFCIIEDSNVSLKDRGEVYSTEETRIGTWINGKPLYRKVFIIPAFNVNNDSLFTIGTVLNVDKVCRSDGELVISNVDRSLPINNCIGTVQTTKTGNVSKIEYYALYSCTYTQGFCVMEYTKTTDEPEVIA